MSGVPHLRTWLLSRDFCKRVELDCELPKGWEALTITFLHRRGRLDNGQSVLVALRSRYDVFSKRW